jgi:protein-S-isoprenylcysteine O-methyltransferase Ste14
MDGVRRLLAIVSMTMWLPALLLWPIIHPFVALWRRVGPFLTYVIVGLLLAGVALVGWRERSLLLMADLGTNWILVAAGLALNVALIYWEVRFGLRMRHLNLVQRLGVPELRGVGDPRALMQDGLYGIVRHPLYVGVVLHAIGWALLANYGGVYLLSGATVVVMALVIALEERELTHRFGDVYRDYQRAVPCVLPRWGTVGHVRAE